MLIHDCIPCQHGHHERCMGVYAPAPEGMLGGAMCGCTGDCRKRYSEVVGLDPVPDGSDFPVPASTREQGPS